MSAKILLSSQEIQKKVEELALQVSKDYKGKQPILLGVLNGSYIFMADLTRELWNQGLKEFIVEFVGVTSYGHGKESSREPQVNKDVTQDVTGRDVIIVEDIVDTGWTFDFLLKHLQEKKPSSIKTLVLLSKPGKREIEVPIDYVGFEIGNDWVEGYGLDSGKFGRGCPDLLVINPD